MSENLDSLSNPMAPTKLPSFSTAFATVTTYLLSHLHPNKDQSTALSLLLAAFDTSLGMAIIIWGIVSSIG